MASKDKKYIVNIVKMSALATIPTILISLVIAMGFSILISVLGTGLITNTLMAFLTVALFVFALSMHKGNEPWNYVLITTVLILAFSSIPTALVSFMTLVYTESLCGFLLLTAECLLGLTIIEKYLK